MSGAGFHVHGPHDHAVEHETQGHGHADHGSEKGKSDAKFIQWVAIFTAVLATVGAIVSYKGGHTQNEALLLKNQAVLKKAEASNQWSYFQAKGTKQNLAELGESLTASPDVKAKFAADIARYKAEKEEIKAKAEALDKASSEADKKSAHEMEPHDKLAQAMTFIQIAISLAAICVLTRKRWMLGLAGGAAIAGMVYTVLAFLIIGGGVH